jgi:hypothetical protein
MSADVIWVKNKKCERKRVEVKKRRQLECKAYCGRKEKYNFPIGRGE